MDIQAFLTQAYPGQAGTGTSLPQAQTLSQLPHHLLLRGHLLIGAKFPSKDITGPVGLASFPCPFAHPSGALSDTGLKSRCSLCRMDVVRNALLGGLPLLPSHSCMRP